MKKIIEYEIMKFINKRKNKLLILALLLFIIGINIYNYRLYENYNDSIVEEYKLISERAKSKLDVLNDELTAQSELDEKEKWVWKTKRIENEIKYLNVEAPVTGRIANAYKKAEEDPEWNKLLLKYLSERYTNIVDCYEKGYIDDIYLSERKINIQEAKHYKYKYDYLLENTIMFQTNEYRPTGANTFSLLFKRNNILVMISIIILLSMDIFLSSIMEGSYKIEYTQPFERKDIFWGKFICTLLIVSIILATMFILNFIINSILFGIGDFNYPQIVSSTINKLTLKSNEGNFVVITLNSKIILGVLMIIALVLLSITLIIFLSIFTDSLEETMGISIVIAVAAFTFNIIANKNSIVNLLYPYMYCFYENVISGFYRCNYLLGIIMNIGLSILFILISYVKFRNKDFLGASE